MASVRNWSRSPRYSHVLWSPKSQAKLHFARPASCNRCYNLKPHNLDTWCCNQTFLQYEDCTEVLSWGRNEGGWMLEDGLGGGGGRRGMGNTGDRRGWSPCPPSTVLSTCPLGCQTTAAPWELACLQDSQTRRKFQTCVCWFSARSVYWMHFYSDVNIQQ